jgi:hypothetical protein
MKKEIKSIGVLQSSKVTALLGFIISATYALPMGIYTLLQGEDKSLAVMFFLLPVFYLIFGFLVYAIIYYLYNQVAKMVGGIEIEVVDKG